MKNVIQQRLGHVRQLTAERLDRLAAALPPVKDKLPLAVYLARAANVQDPKFQTQYKSALSQWQAAGGSVKDGLLW